MLRADLIRTLVLNEVGDDYENFYQIKTEVMKVGTSSGLGIEPAEIAAALVDLLATGMVRAYRLYPSPIEEVPNSVAIARLPVDALTVLKYSDQKTSDYYYLQTPKGREFHQGAAWPFDEDGRLLCAIENGA
jgi:hypothetical protein